MKYLIFLLILYLFKWCLLEIYILLKRIAAVFDVDKWVLFNVNNEAIMLKIVKNFYLFLSHCKFLKKDKLLSVFEFKTSKLKFAFSKFVRNKIIVKISF